MGANRIFSRFAELLDIKVTRAAAAWLRLNADGTVTERTAAQTLSDIGAQAALDLKANLASPTFTTPSLGAATATTINKVTITQPATGATLTIADYSSIFVADGGYITTGVNGSITTSTGGNISTGLYGSITTGTSGSISTVAGGSFATGSGNLTGPNTSGTIALTDQVDGKVNLVNSVFGVLPTGAGGTGATNAADARTALGLGTGDVVTHQATVLSGQSLTGSQATSLADLSATWNTTGTPTAIKVNVTDTASNASSLLMDLRVGGVSKFRVDKSGAITLANGSINSVANIAMNQYLTGAAGIWASNAGTIGWSDAQFNRDGAANTLAQRNGTNAQAFRVYGTFTARGSGTTNLEALEIKGQATGAFIIQSLKGSAGGLAENIEFRHGATDTNGTITNGTLAASVTSTGFNVDGLLAVGNAAPVSRLDLAETWNRVLTVTGASGNGTTATITFAAQATVIPVGARITVASINPSGYNGTFTVTASTLTSVSYANATTTAYVSGGTVSQIYTAIRSNVTDTASDVNSLLMDLQVGGATRFSVNKAGALILPSTNTIGISGANLFLNPNGQGTICGGILYIGGQAGTDLILLRDAANTLAQRNGTNAQTSRIYDTYTSATDYHRLAIATARATATMTGASVTLAGLIPAGAVVVGVTTKVTTAITGATGYSVGTAASPTRFGSNVAVALGTTSDNRNWTGGTIECFPSGADIILTAVGSNFTAGVVYVSIQYMSGQAD